MARKQLLVNKSQKRVMLQCKTLVDKNAVSRVSIDGVQHIVITSKTLPDNIVMNGGLYPADEVNNSYQTLNKTLAPLEHPQDANGNYISASDPIAIHNYHAGAWNENARKEDGRIIIDKYINVQEAQKTERGKRLLDRIDEIETSKSPRPIHTSVGVFCTVEEVEPATNDAGQEYTWIARDMVFDHDAILLDSVGAAQPDQGVGIAVNASGQECDVHISADIDSDEPLSHNEIRKVLEKAINEAPYNASYVVDVKGDNVIYCAYGNSTDKYFSAKFEITDREAKIVSSPIEIEVDWDVTYTPKTNQKGDAMKKMIVNALKAKGIDTDGMNDEQLFAKYNEIIANDSDSDGADDNGNGNDIADIVANAVKPLADQMAAMQTKLNEQSDKELDDLAEIIGNSDKYAGIDKEAAKKLGVETLREMSANCLPAHGLPLTVINGKQGDKPSYEMPA